MPAHRPRTPFHFLRATAVATVILTLAAGAHLAAGGELPAPAIMLAVLSLTALGSTTATRLRLGFPALAVLLGGGSSPPAARCAPAARVRMTVATAVARRRWKGVRGRCAGTDGPPPHDGTGSRQRRRCE